MLDILKNMSRRIVEMKARMQDSCDQMVEVLNKRSNEILEIKEQLKALGSHKILENQNDVFQESPTILESNMLKGALVIKIVFFE